MAACAEQIASLQRLTPADRGVAAAKLVQADPPLAAAVIAALLAKPDGFASHQCNALLV